MNPWRSVPLVMPATGDWQKGLKVLNKSYPRAMECECDLLNLMGEQIHCLPDCTDEPVCDSIAYVKFQVKEEGMWLCPECMGHHVIREV